MRAGVRGARADAHEGVRGAVSGAILLEVTLALAILVVAGLAVLSAVGQANRAMVAARDRAVLTDLARSAVALIESGAATAESLNGPVAAWPVCWSDRERAGAAGGMGATGGAARAAEGIPTFALRIVTEPLGVDGLVALTVTAVKLGPGGGTGAAGDGEALATVTLRQGVRVSRPRRGGLQRGTWRGVRRGRNPARGFTLLEVLVALALLTLLLTAAATYLWQVQAGRAKLRTIAERSAATGTFFDRLEAELLAVVSGDRVLGAGFRGDGVSLALLTLAPSAGEVERGDVRGGMVSSVYRFDGGSGRLVVTRRDALRAGSPAAERVLGEGLVRVRLRYYASGAAGIGSWRGAFDSREAGGLPAAVEVAVWFVGSRAGETGGPAASAAGAGEGLSEPEAEAARLARGAERADESAEDEELPPPDRVRVIAIPGGGSGGGGGGSAAEGGL